MQFTKRLHEPIVTCSIRIWTRMHAKIGGKYRLGQGPGYILIKSITEKNRSDITDALALESGFKDRSDLLKTAQHGSGQDIYLIRFIYIDGDISSES
ncbi:MAG: ASCH domain-containing protein [Rhodothermales bacterium]